MIEKCKHIADLPWDGSPEDLARRMAELRDHPDFVISEWGKSAEGRALYRLEWGRGPMVVALWAQVHGNEGLSAGALGDLILDLAKGEHPPKWPQALTLRIYPQVNPDGAAQRRRLNAQGLDLNRDVKARQSPEMAHFWPELQAQNIHWAFNLHDQRSLFSVGSPPQPAVLSFLSPSVDAQGQLSPTRIKTMNLIGQTVEALRKSHPQEAYGRYCDEFYPLALGDNLQGQAIPCVLLEVGQGCAELGRLRAREFLSEALERIAQNIDATPGQAIDSYLTIPENQKLLRDRIYRQVQIGESPYRTDLGLQRQWNGTQWAWRETDRGDLSHLRGYSEWEGGFFTEPQNYWGERWADIIWQGAEIHQYQNGIWQKR